MTKKPAADPATAAAAESEDRQDGQVVTLSLKQRRLRAAAAAAAAAPPLESAPTALASDAVEMPDDPPPVEPAPQEEAPLLLVAGQAPADLQRAAAGFRIIEIDLDAAPVDARLRAATAGALGLIADTGRAAAARAWADAAGLPDLAILPADSVERALPLALARRLTMVERDAGQARRASALLRREGEAVNRRLRAIERFMYSLGGPRLSQALNWSPTGTLARVKGDPAAIVQRLPIDSPGITAVDLWMPDAGEDAARALGVAIEDSEGHRHALTLDEVSVTRDDGWLRYASDEPLSGDRQDCRLVIQHAPDGLGFGLGSPVPDPFFAVQGLPETERVLALRIWRAVAGSTLNAAGAGTAVGRGRNEGSVAKRIMPADLPRPTMFASPRAAKDHISTAFWQKEDAVLVHPSASGPVCAMLQRAPLANLNRLSAVVHAPRKDGPTLAFAIGVAPSGTITENDWDEHIGAWTVLPPGGWGEVHSIPLRTPLTGRLCDIVLATTVTGGTDNKYAWALFRAFRAVWKQGA